MVNYRSFRSVIERFAGGGATALLELPWPGVYRMRPIIKGVPADYWSTDIRMQHLTQTDNR